MSSAARANPSSRGDRSTSPRPKVRATMSAPSRGQWMHTVSAAGSTSQYSATPCFA